MSYLNIHGDVIPVLQIWGGLTQKEVPKHMTDASDWSSSPKSP